MCNSRSHVWVFVLLVVAASVALRYRLLDTPLERDEGEYACAGQLIRQGIPPYLLVYNMKLPGTYVTYALIMAIFGETTAGIRLGLMVVNSCSIILVFLLGRRLFDERTGVVACATFALLSVGTGVNGFAAHATHFVTLWALAGMLVLLRALASGSRLGFLVSGILFGVATLMKQPGLFFSVFGFGVVLLDVWRRRTSPIGKRLAPVGLYAVGVVIPLLVTCLLLAWTGVFDRFWFWTILYAREYATQVPLRDAVRSFVNSSRTVFSSSIAYWYLAVVGLFAGCCLAQTRQSTLRVGWLCICSFLVACPGFYFRPHYFIVMLPAVALLVGVAVTATKTIIERRPNIAFLRWAPMGAFAAATALCILQQRQVFFSMSPDEVCRSTYGVSNPFVETIEVAKYIESHSSPSDRIAVLGSEPQLFFYSARRSATGYIYMYPLTEKHPFALRMQKDMIAEIESARPIYIVIIDSPDSTGLGPHSETLLANWADTYLSEHYGLVGLVAIDRGQTSYYWDGQLPQSFPRMQYSIRVFRRVD